MKNTLLISLLVIGSSAVAQETTTIDTLQEPPRGEAVIGKRLLLEHALSKNWEFDHGDQRSTFRFIGCIPMYVISFRFTDVPTEQPQSLNPDRPIPERRDYQHIETKFQVNLKTKIIQSAFGKGDIWAASTQQTYWQMYNGKLSRPFRGVNYGPEFIFTYPLSLSAGDFKMRMIELSVNHQSSGKEIAHSRS